jgi:hypothetical protein
MQFCPWRIWSTRSKKSASDAAAKLPTLSKSYGTYQGGIGKGALVRGETMKKVICLKEVNRCTATSGFVPVLGFPGQWFQWEGKQQKLYRTTTPAEGKET